MVDQSGFLTCDAVSSNAKIIVTGQVIAHCNDIVQPPGMRKDKRCLGTRDG